MATENQGSYPSKPGAISSTGEAPPPGSAVGYAPGQPVVVQPVVVQQSSTFRESPVTCVCPHCHQNITTSTKAEAGVLTWLIAGALCLFGCWLGCCCVPFCVDACQNIRHSCPNCKTAIHVFSRL